MTSDPAAVAIIGGGPAGLIAAEHLAHAGYRVSVYDRMPSVGRKFLMAGRGGLNLTHSEPQEDFLQRYGSTRAELAPFLKEHDAAALREWSHALGEETFIGSSGRVFPKSFKASPLLRAWLRRLASLGVQFRTGHRWTGWTPDGALQFETPTGPVTIASDAVLLALGGASWPRLGSDGGWVSLLEARQVAVAPLQPANSGFDVSWSRHLQERFAGAPLKRIALTFAGKVIRGEAILTADGIEGGAVYAHSSALRGVLRRDGAAALLVDLRPDLALDMLVQKLGGDRKGESLANWLRKRLALPPVAIALLNEITRDAPRLAPEALAALIKALPIVIRGVRPINRAISTAGGVRWDMLDSNLMLKALPGVFCAGEMIDWEAPTGGYLLQACFATGIGAARGVERYLGGPGF